jgi:hypothetical protein
MSIKLHSDSYSLTSVEINYKCGSRVCQRFPQIHFVHIGLKDREEIYEKKNYRSSLYYITARDVCSNAQPEGVTSK